MYLTYRDVIDHLIDVFNFDGKDVNDVVARKIRRASENPAIRFTRFTTGITSFEPE